MQIKEMQLGKTVEIHVDREGYHYRFVSKVEAVTSNSVAVSRIAAKNRSFHFEDEDVIVLIYRSGERMWKWEYVKGGLAMLDGIAVHTFTSQAEGTIYNRRESFRVPIGERCPMRRIVKEEGENGEIIENEIGFEALVADLSVTGAGLYTNETLELKTEIVFDIPTRDGVLKCRGTIIRSSEVYDKPYRHFYGCTFTVVKRGLERYLVERQRKMLQRQRGG